MLLLRHGQSEWNAIRRWQGSADTPLTDLGREQAHRTAERLVALDVEFTGPWTSDLVRASETADILGRALGLEPPCRDPRLREAHAGEWQGMTPDEIEVSYPGWLAAHRRPSTFESYERVVARAVDAIADAVAVAASGEVPLVVTHSGLIRSIVRHLGLADGRIPNLGGVWFEITLSPDAFDGGGHATASPSRSRLGADDLDIVVGDLFDPGVPVSGVDAPGEDPGEQTDETDADRSTQH